MNPPDFERKLEDLLAVEPRVSWADEPLGVRVTRWEVVLIRLMIAGGLIAIAAFLWWFFGEDRIGTPWLYWPLTAVLIYKLTLTVYQWFCYLGVRPRRAVPLPTPRRIDVLTTWCPGEPREMVVATLKAMTRMRGEKTIYLCDEGDDLLLKAVCERLGVRHMTRENKVGAKAGNINNALQQATGEIAVIFDPDHEPAPFFLERLVGYFDDPKVGFVQCVQGYYNQGESLIARGAAEQTYHFYGPTMTGMDAWGTVQAIGANCAFRRAALDSIGGHATGLAEDMATTLKLYSEGWKSVYVPEVLTRGLVPSTYAGYTKQQLKWACGVWDILIETFWRVWPKLSWVSRVHFLQNGLFYLRGPFVLIGALIPIAALTTGAYPWKITIVEFIQWFGPVLAAILFVRQMAQRWVLEPAERGFHTVGGFLINGTWWTHMSGAVCSMLRIKIPYIPTPKDDAAADAWRISRLNIALALVSLGAAIYGIWWDWSPYAGLMAAFALLNFIVFGFVVVIAQQATIGRISTWRRGGPIDGAKSVSGHEARHAGDGLLTGARAMVPTLALLVAFAAAATNLLDGDMTPEERLWAEMTGRTDKVSDGFLLGAYAPALNAAAEGHIPPDLALGEIDVLAKELEAQFSIVSLYHWWSDRSLAAFPASKLDAIRARGAIPMITWGPVLDRFAAAKGFADFDQNVRVFDKILSGQLDGYIEAYAERIRDHGGPVFMRFAHEMDNPQYSWSDVGGNTAEEFIAAWRYVVTYFDGMGATNAVWVWNPWRAEAFATHYPGDDYVDWIGLTLLNYGNRDGDGSWDAFADLYAPFEGWLAGHTPRVMLAEFGSTSLGGDRVAWIQDAFEEIAARPRIEAAVLFESGEDRNWPATWSAEAAGTIDWRIGKDAPSLTAVIDEFAATRPMRRPAPALTKVIEPAPRRIEKIAGGWQFMVDGTPFFVRGVAYGIGHDWRSSEPATRATIERDFEAIAQMGANTVRRYATSWADRNILEAAQANGLRVMMGFWLNPEIDFRTDDEELARIEAHVAETVRHWHDHPAVLSWTVGNETWGQLKHRFAQPELTEVRSAYIAFIERLAQVVKTVDPTRPVFTSLEYSSELPGALSAIAENAPSLDGIGVNAYYTPHLDRLDHLVGYFGSGMPWMLSEFGPNGYWDADHTAWSPQGFALEPSDTEKAEQYVTRWQRFVDGLAPRTLGGVAFTWTDRLEGSITWFGLTDTARRHKPAYHALRAAWTGVPATPPALPYDLSLVAPDQSFSVGHRTSIAARAADWPPKCRSHWRLVAAADFSTVSELEGACDSARVWSFNLPHDPGRYRAHLSVSWGDEAVTASLPLLVE